MSSQNKWNQICRLLRPGGGWQEGVARSMGPPCLGLHCPWSERDQRPLHLGWGVEEKPPGSRFLSREIKASSFLLLIKIPTLVSGLSRFPQLPRPLQP